MFLSGGICLVVAAVFVFDFNMTQRFLNEWVCVNDLFFALWCLCYFYQEAFVKIYFETKVSSFYYVLAILIYVSTTILFLSVWFIVKSDAEHSVDELKIIHHIFNITLYILFVFGFITDYMNSEKINSTL